MRPGNVKTSDFDYQLPTQYIAQTPVEPRHSARLLVLERASGNLTHSIFQEVGNFLHPGDTLVLNETRVLPARLYARKVPGGGRVEILLLRKETETQWEVIVGGGGLKAGRYLIIANGPEAQVVQVLNGARRLVQFLEPIEPYLPHAGHVPLPPYIHVPLSDAQRYQTVYARLPGSVAAPTAGLHFTSELMESLKKQGIQFVTVTLHVGLDTFAPVNEENPRAHQIHSEWCQISPQASAVINQAWRDGKRIIAVGTTSVRTLESAAGFALPGELVGVFEGFTRLFILPGYKFRVVDAMITNFHLPRSTLLMLVSAFAGLEMIIHAYKVAMAENYRFYSFGDAMLIL